MSADQKGILVAIVAIISIIQNTRNFYNIYVTVQDTSDQSYQRIKNLESRTQRIIITLINPSKKLDFISNITFRDPSAAFYRLELQNLLPNIDRIIYMDIDCLVFDDLYEMYNLNMTGINIRGVLDPNPYLNDHIIRNDKYICSGVLLMNLKRMRETKIIDKYVKFINENRSLLNKCDQTLINTIDWQFNDILPIKYGVLFCNLNENKYFNQLRVKLYSKDEIKNALQYPVIAHLICKPFLHFCREKVCGVWWYYSRLALLPAQYKHNFPIYFRYKKVLAQMVDDGLINNLKSIKVVLLNRRNRLFLQGWFSMNI